MAKRKHSAGIESQSLAVWEKKLFTYKSLQHLGTMTEKSSDLSEGRVELPRK